MAFPPAPEPATRLGRYRRLAPSAGIYVSPLHIGAMSLGTKWPFVGSTDKVTAFEYLDAYFNAGGNFIDTANNYQGGESEEWVGEWMEARGNRDQLVIATKFSAAWEAGNPKVKSQATLLGNSVKSMTLSLEASLKKLKTTYVDVFYVHWWDWTTSVEELMEGLHNLVRQGKVLYLGASNAPAWKIAQCNQYARDHGKPQFVIYQGEWNVLKRDVERDILPMCREYGMAFTPWNMLRSGRLRTDAEEEEREKAGVQGRRGFNPDWKRNDLERQMASVLERTAAQVGTKDIRAVLIAYHLQKMPYVFPLIGGNKVAQLEANIDALRISLTNEQIKEIESAAPFDVGFPASFIGDGSTPNMNNRSVIYIDVEPLAAAIRPSN
ncbi:NADP-dependent oxidoreductase domain-containing protein [Phanerochaete sordida]|uniref:NADP-dependent oxidoreductase domain-containing protein n=1 Tax=Phanerochaete sordida TaxID=48140 RepID=A0A9P3LCI5_9APHY|nr:NADP-dependent oxidoreductase domain-containing protein [Phanerochaete sordida]